MADIDLPEEKLFKYAKPNFLLVGAGLGRLITSARHLLARQLIAADKYPRVDEPETPFLEYLCQSTFLATLGADTTQAIKWVAIDDTPFDSFLVAGIRNNVTNVQHVYLANYAKSRRKVFLPLVFSVARSSLGKSREEIHEWFWESAAERSTLPSVMLVVYEDDPAAPVNPAAPLFAADRRSDLEYHRKDVDVGLSFGLIATSLALNTLTGERSRFGLDFSVYKAFWNTAIGSPDHLLERLYSEETLSYEARCAMYIGFPSYTTPLSGEFRHHVALQDVFQFWKNSTFGVGDASEEVLEGHTLCFLDLFDAQQVAKVAKGYPLSRVLATVSYSMGQGVSTHEEQNDAMLKSICLADCARLLRDEPITKLALLPNHEAVFEYLNQGLSSHVVFFCPVYWGLDEWHSRVTAFSAILNGLDEHTASSIDVVFYGLLGANPSNLRTMPYTRFTGWVQQNIGDVVYGTGVRCEIFTRTEKPREGYGSPFRAQAMTLSSSTLLPAARLHVLHDLISVWYLHAEAMEANFRILSEQFEPRFNALVAENDTALSDLRFYPDGIPEWNLASVMYGALRVLGIQGTFFPTAKDTDIVVYLTEEELPSEPGLDAMIGLLWMVWDYSDLVRADDFFQALFGVLFSEWGGMTRSPVVEYHPQAMSIPSTIPYSRAFDDHTRRTSHDLDATEDYLLANERSRGSIGSAVVGLITSTNPRPAHRSLEKIRAALSPALAECYDYLRPLITVRRGSIIHIDTFVRQQLTTIEFLSSLLQANDEPAEVPQSRSSSNVWDMGERLNELLHGNVPFIPLEEESPEGALPGHEAFDNLTKHLGFHPVKSVVEGRKRKATSSAATDNIHGLSSNWILDKSAMPVPEDLPTWWDARTSFPMGFRSVSVKADTVFMAPLIQLGEGQIVSTPTELAFVRETNHLAANIIGHMNSTLDFKQQLSVDDRDFTADFVHHERDSVSLLESAMETQPDISAMLQGRQHALRELLSNDPDRRAQNIVALLGQYPLFLEHYIISTSILRGLYTSARTLLVVYMRLLRDVSRRRYIELWSDAQLGHMSRRLLNALRRVSRYTLVTRKVVSDLLSMNTRLHYYAVNWHSRVGSSGGDERAKKWLLDTLESLLRYSSATSIDEIRWRPRDTAVTSSGKPVVSDMAPRARSPALMIMDVPVRIIREAILQHGFTWVMRVYCFYEAYNHYKATHPEPQSIEQLGRLWHMAGKGTREERSWKIIRESLVEIVKYLHKHVVDPMTREHLEAYFSGFGWYMQQAYTRLMDRAQVVIRIYSLFLAREARDLEVVATRPVASIDHLVYALYMNPAEHVDEPDIDRLITDTELSNFGYPDTHRLRTPDDLSTAAFLQAPPGFILLAAKPWPSSIAELDPTYVNRVVDKEARPAYMIVDSSGDTKQSELVVQTIVLPPVINRTMLRRYDQFHKGISGIFLPTYRTKSEDGRMFEALHSLVTRLNDYLAQISPEAWIRHRELYTRIRALDFSTNGVVKEAVELVNTFWPKGLPYREDPFFQNVPLGAWDGPRPAAAQHPSTEHTDVHDTDFLLELDEDVMRELSAEEILADVESYIAGLPERRGSEVPR